MKNGPFIDGLPIKNGGSFHGYVSHNQMVEWWSPNDQSFSDAFEDGYPMEIGGQGSTDRELGLWIFHMTGLKCAWKNIFKSWVKCEKTTKKGEGKNTQHTVGR